MLKFDDNVESGLNFFLKFQLHVNKRKKPKINHPSIMRQNNNSISNINK